MQKVVQQFDRRTMLNTTGFMIYSRDPKHWDGVIEKAERLLAKIRPYAKPGVCIQAGGWCGAYPIVFSEYFHSVHTYEPERHNFNILKHNTKDNIYVGINECALADGCYNRHMVPSRSTLAHRLSLGAGSTKCVSIDSLNLSSCEAIILDVVGSEILALNGAKETIKKFEPVIVVESKVRNDILAEVKKTIPEYVKIETVGTKHIFVHYWKAYQYGYS